MDSAESEAAGAPEVRSIAEEAIPTMPGAEAGPSSPSSSETMSAGSLIRPGPTSPQACQPASGPMIRTPRPTSTSRLACVAAARHICWFMAGASTIGAGVARHTVASRSSAKPCASRAIRFAVAGAASTTSAQRASSMWPIAASAVSSRRSRWTGSPETAWKVSGVTKACAPAVITTRTSCPASLSRRTISGLL